MATPASPQDVLRRRLLLVLFGLGTNMGIKRVAVTGKHGESEVALRRVRHLRYRGPCVMTYWHVERESVCTYPQLESCSVCEVASMIEGVHGHPPPVDTRASPGRLWCGDRSCATDAVLPGTSCPTPG
ncbi:hypothetical protein SUDANB58_05839 (plasmid) [Streptomyces sp. enrichment culture]|uniref:Tn3 family transposase n=1 Tax=Streptomyces sp. enrichment culture TaxID=1795815 RepID=UPI003F56869D